MGDVGEEEVTLLIRCCESIETSWMVEATLRRVCLKCCAHRLKKKQQFKIEILSLDSVAQTLK